MRPLSFWHVVSPSGVESRRRIPKCLAQWTTQCLPDHLSGASGPALVLAWLIDGDGQVISTPVVTLKRTRRALCPIVFSTLLFGTHIVQDVEFTFHRIGAGKAWNRGWKKLLRYCHVGDQLR